MTIMDSMDDLIHRFKAESAERLQRIEELLAGMPGDAAFTERCNEIREEAHKLKGAAGVLGYPEMKNSAGELEDIVAAYAASNDVDSSARDAEVTTGGEDPIFVIGQAVGELRSNLP